MMKNAIFEAATSVVNEHGVEGTTMNRVAVAAELAKSSLYDYFPSKEELLNFVYERLIVPFIEAVHAVTRAEMPAPQKLAEVLRIAFERMTKHKVFLRMLSESGGDDQARKKGRPQILEVFTAIFEQGIKEGSFPPVIPRTFAHVHGICHGVDGVAEEWRV